MIETVVIGFTVVAVTLPIMLMVTRMTEASDIAAGDARTAAVWFARHGELPGNGSQSSMDVEVVDGVVRVSTAVEVDLIAIGGSKVKTTVSGYFEMPISPYRSNR
jgi:hypothetical protein